MFEFNVVHYVPKFILRDKNGYALAKAIEAGIQMMNDIIETGVAYVNDVDEMPEWRLDELGWEYGILYDSTQDVEVKRQWVAKALELYKEYGTKNALVEYLTAVFDTVKLEEASAYGGSPYHFRLKVDGNYSVSNRDLIYKAIETVGNVRSVCDGITYGAVESNPVVYYAGAAAASWSIVNSATVEEGE